jgi:hypothetical protein
MPDSRVSLDAFISEFRKMKMSAEKAMAQLADDELHHKLNPQQCSIATYIQHLHGNMGSRWTDFLTTDGEKPSRNRDAEFVDAPRTRQELLSLWNEGWATVFAALATLSDSDLGKPVLIRAEPHTVALAITRQIAHYAWHVGQIVLLAKHFVVARGRRWDYLTIPPGESSAFNSKMGMK